MRQARFFIDAMDCPTEEQILRNGLKNHAAVRTLDFDLMNRVLTVTLTEAGDIAQVQTTLTKLGMPGELQTDGAANDERHARSAAVARRKGIALGLSGALAAAAEILHWTTHDEGSVVMALLVFASIALSGRDTFRKGLTAVRTFTLNINFLMTLAVVGALIVREWPEAAMVTFLFAVAEQIESYSLERARRAIASLLETVPETARVADGDGWREVAIAAVSVGQTIQVRPGERVPLDGIVRSGGSAVNQAAITGESLPVEKQPGDPTFAGTVNGRGSLTIEVTAAKGATTLDRIVRAVQQAQASRAPTQRFVDRFALAYTPTVVALAIGIAVIGPLVAGGGWSDWLYRALVLLVIACPCALVISTPVTVVSGLTAAARLGILIKGGGILETGRSLKAIALDKTGTVTYGRPVVTDIVPLTQGRSSQEMLHLAASLNASSEHPIAAAIVSSCAVSHPDGERCVPFPVTDFEALVGRGVTGRLDGQRYYIGSHRLTHENAVCSPAIEAEIAALEQQGKTAVILTSDQSALAVLGVADRPRETAAAAIAALRRQGIRTILLTGDNAAAARAIAAEMGIDEVRAELLPEEKQAQIEALHARYGAVGMVGDGINDAPALAQATIGFAMGAAGTAVAVETADVALMEDDLRKIPLFLQLSRQTAAVLVQNITIALGIKVVFFALALAGHATLWMAVFADVGASLLVVLNGLRMLRFRK